jgi:hypothetical protein
MIASRDTSIVSMPNGYGSKIVMKLNMPVFAMIHNPNIRVLMIRNAGVPVIEIR